MIKLDNWSRVRRQPVGSLGLARVTTKTSEGYTRVIEHFEDWLSSGGWDAPRSVRELDCLAARYVEDSFAQSLPKSWVLHLLAALVLFQPALKGDLPTLAAALAGWRHMCPGGSWPPLPLDLAVAVSSVLFHMGHEEGATAVLLSFDCYLRISEVVGLLVTDVVLPGDALLGVNTSIGSVNLRVTKTGRDQSVLIHARLVEALLRRRREDVRRSGHEFLFPSLTIRKLRGLFHKALLVLGVPRNKFTFHSLRHGGATFDFLHRRLTFAEVQHRGRWVSTKTCRIYLQRGRSALLSTVLPSGVMAVLKGIRTIPSHRLFGLDEPVAGLRSRSKRRAY